MIAPDRMHTRRACDPGVVSITPVRWTTTSIGTCMGFHSHAWSVRMRILYKHGRHLRCSVWCIQRPGSDVNTSHTPWPDGNMSWTCGGSCASRSMRTARGPKPWARSTTSAIFLFRPGRCDGITPPRHHCPNARDRKLLCQRAHTDGSGFPPLSVSVLRPRELRGRCIPRLRRVQSCLQLYHQSTPHGDGHSVEPRVGGNGAGFMFSTLFNDMIPALDGNASKRLLVQTAAVHRRPYESVSSPCVATRRTTHRSQQTGTSHASELLLRGRQLGGHGWWWWPARTFLNVTHLGGEHRRRRKKRNTHGPADRKMIVRGLEPR